MKLNKRAKLLKKILITLLNDWSIYDITTQYYGIKMYMLLFVRFLVKIIAICILPITLIVSVYVIRYFEIQNLKSWVTQMRKDTGFFHDHYYIELKRHLNVYKEDYEVILNW